MVINMTRCNYLEDWFDNESAKLDKVENDYGKCLVTGQKKKTTTLTKAQAWAKVFRRNKEGVGKILSNRFLPTT